MSLPHALMWAIVLVVGVPSAWRNPTAGALVLCWVFSEGLWALTGNGLAVAYYAYPDAFVIAVIFAKPEWCNLGWDRGWLLELKCILLERSPCDRIILLSYPVVWTLYVVGIAPYYQWWSLYWIAVAQFVVAAWEPLSKLLRSRAEAADRQPDYPGDLLVAYPAGGWGGP
jgi:hypothetical protein